MQGFYNSTSGYVWPLDIAKAVPDAAAREMRRSYYASVSWLDFCVGRVLTALEENHLKDSTTVVLHGDHGWQLGEHNSWHKFTNFELAARVPLIIRAPGISASIGKVVRGFAELVDLYHSADCICHTIPSVYP